MPLAFIPSPARDIWHLGFLPVRLQGVFAVAGVLLAIVVAERRYRAAGGRPGVITDIAAWAVPAGLVPAALGAFLAPVHDGFWQQVRIWDDALGFPGAAALGTLAAWVAVWIGHVPRNRRKRLPFAPVLGAVAPAMLFGLAVADLGGWASQQGYGHPASLWWAVQVSPAHRLSGYENFATFQPMFLYEALWNVATGAAVIWATRRFPLVGDRVFALAAVGYAAGGFALFWLGIGHLPLVLGIRAGELGDVIVGVGSVTYLARTRHRRTPPLQAAQKLPLERDSPVM
jgi:prolipoprotein diacylglyceryltransferase